MLKVKIASWIHSGLYRPPSTTKETVFAAVSPATIKRWCQAHESRFPQTNLMDFQPLTVEKFRPYGWLLGKTIRMDASIPAFSNAEIDFWQEHLFDPGTGGETEVLWVT